MGQGVFPCVFTYKLALRYNRDDVSILSITFYMNYQPVPRTIGTGVFLSKTEKKLKFMAYLRIAWIFAYQALLGESGYELRELFK